MTADFSESTTTWGDDDPSVFVVSIAKDLLSLFDDIPNKDLLVRKEFTKMFPSSGSHVMFINSCLIYVGLDQWSRMAHNYSSGP